MLPSLLLPAFLSLQTPTPPPPQPPDLKPLSFFSRRFDYKWDTMLPLNIDVDGLKVGTIFFNRRQVRSWPLKGADFGARAQVEVTNRSSRVRTPGFVVAVFDAEDRLLAAGSGGAKVGSIDPGSTETFDLNLNQVNERLPLGAYFYLSVELRE